MERVIQHIVDQAWGPDVVDVHSAGTGALVGSPMDPEGLEILRDRRVDTTDFVARQIAKEHVSSSNLVLTATRAHRGPVSTLHPRSLRYTFAVGDFVHLASHIRDEDLPTTDDAAGWITEIAQLVAQRRGYVAPRESRVVDIVDPYRRGDDVWREMTQQLDGLWPGLTRALGGDRHGSSRIEH